MIKLIRLLWKFAPHLLLAFSILGFISGVAAMFGPQPPPEPVGMALQQIGSTAPDKLPAWVKVDDGRLDWSQAKLVVMLDKKTDETKGYDRVVVPLTGEGGIAGSPRSGNLLLVDLPWDEMLAKFPAEAASLKSGQAPAGAGTPYQVVFEPVSGDKEFTSSIERQILDKFRALGFKEFTAVRPGSKPMSRSDGAGVAVTMLITAGGSVWWLRRRRKQAVLKAVRSGFSKGLREAIDESAAGAVSQTVNFTPAPAAASGERA